MVIIDFMLVPDQGAVKQMQKVLGDDRSDWTLEKLIDKASLDISPGKKCPARTYALAPHRSIFLCHLFNFMRKSMSRVRIDLDAATDRKSVV